METAETEERGSSESGITNNMISKGGFGHPFFYGLRPILTQKFSGIQPGRPPDNAQLCERA